MIDMLAARNYFLFSKLEGKTFILLPVSAKYVDGILYTIKWHLDIESDK